MSSTRSHSPHPDPAEDTDLPHTPDQIRRESFTLDVSALNLKCNNNSPSKTPAPVPTADEADNQLVRLNLELDKLKRELRVKADSEDQMKQVLREYEKTISDLIMEKENEKKKMEMDIESALAEKNQAIEDLHNVESAFSDVHRKYERTKQVVVEVKKNEEQLKQFVEEYKDKLQKAEQKYNMLKGHASDKLEEANREIDNIRSGQDAEKVKLNAIVQKTEMKVRNLERTLAQKSKENEVKILSFKLSFTNISF